MTDEQYLTAEGAERLRAELVQLKGPAREELAQRLRSAIEMGDLSENADYHAAKEQQGFLEGRIQELEYLLKHAIIIDDNGRKNEQVDIGSHVTIQENNYPPETYMIVGAKEADPSNGRISNVSPFGSAILGKSAGDEVIAKTPQGEVRLRIIKIE
jgi:transcription elongation factor GreA